MEKNGGIEMSEQEVCQDCKDKGITDSEAVVRCDDCDKWLCDTCVLRLVSKGEQMWICHECDDKRPQSEKELDR